METTNLERRIAPAPEVTADKRGKTIVSGYAALFGSRYSMGWYTEEVARTAFDGADLSDVRILFNHNADLILGRTGTTARVLVDSAGLRYQVVLPDAPNGDNVREAIERGDVTASSWGFSLAPDGDRWDTSGKVPHRVITAVRVVYDCSPVTFPANPATDATAATETARRSFEAWRGAKVRSLLAEMDARLFEIEEATEGATRRMRRYDIGLTMAERQMIAERDAKVLADASRRGQLLLAQIDRRLAEIERNFKF